MVRLLGALSKDLLRNRRTDYREDAQRYQQHYLSETQQYKEKNGTDYYNNSRNLVGSGVKAPNPRMDTLDQFKNSYVAPDERYKENKRDSFSVGNRNNQFKEALTYTENKRQDTGYKKSVYNRELDRDTTGNVFPKSDKKSPKPLFSPEEEKFVLNFARFYGVSSLRDTDLRAKPVDPTSKEALNRLLTSKENTFYKYDILRNQKISLMASDKKQRVKEVDLCSAAYLNNLKRFWGMSLAKPLATNLLNTNGLYGRLFN